MTASNALGVDLLHPVGRPDANTPISPYSIQSALQGLGVKSGFDIPRGTANLERIAPRRAGDYLYILDVFQKTVLNLNEMGLEAAAATAIEYRTWGIHEPPKPVEMRVDHPFLFAIVHAPSGACLFLGHLIHPR